MKGLNVWNFSPCIWSGPVVLWSAVRHRPAQYVGQERAGRGGGRETDRLLFFLSCWSPHPPLTQPAVFLLFIIRAISHQPAGWNVIFTLQVIISPHCTDHHPPLSLSLCPPSVVSQLLAPPAHQQNLLHCSILDEMVD